MATPNKNNEIRKIGKWTTLQKNIYDKNEMTEEKRNIWKNFIEKYKCHFIDNNTHWINNLNKTKKYINENKKKPLRSDNNDEIKKNALLLSRQSSKYLQKKEIMKEESVRKLWENFINDYSKFLE